ncbi:MAG: exo-alpha-sialidase [Spirochaetales bacterium]|nr:exo-alpha-sialidase [Spirochaetales bacterium]
MIELFVNESDDRYPSSHASMICELENGDLFTVWFAGSVESAVDTVILGSRLRKGEPECGEADILVNVDQHAAGNPRIFYGPDKALWLIAPVNYGVWCHGGTRLFLKKSFDHGYTWTDLALFIEEPGILGKNRPYQLKSNPEIWIVPTEDEDAYVCNFIRSENMGESWELYGSLGKDENIRVDQPSIIEFDDGKLMVLMRSWEGYIYKSYSEDSGKSWSRVEATSLVNNNSGIDVIRAKSGDLLLVHNPTALSDTGTLIVDQSLKGTPGFEITVSDFSRDKKGAREKNPDIKLVYPKWGPRTPLRISVSRDNGTTWDRVYDLEDQPGEYSYPSLMQGENGDFHVVYTYNRTRIKYVSLEENFYY